MYQQKTEGSIRYTPLRNHGSGGGMQNAVILNETGFNALILHSDKKNAKRLQKKPTEEIMPSILNTGKYIDQDNSFKDAYTNMFTTNSQPVSVTQEHAPKLDKQLEMFQQFKEFQKANDWL